MPYLPQFIKPLRDEDLPPELTSTRVRNNQSEAIETSVVLDLNVLSTMKNVMQKKTPFAGCGLEALVAFFNNNSVYISPGFALGEANQAYIADLYAEYENFMQQYCPGYVDAPNSLQVSQHKKRSRKFSELEQGDRYSLIVSYLSMLAIQVIAREQEEKSPEEKFAAYVDYMSGEADMLAALEAEVAKFWFYDRTELKEGDFKRSCKVIRDNFNKGGKGQGRLAYILNSARDLVYLRMTAVQDGQFLTGGGIQDTWLVTGDEALVELVKYIYFCPVDGGEASHVAWPEIEEKKESSYWRDCDQLFYSTVCMRNITPAKPFTESDFQRLFSLSKTLENKVLTYWPAV